MTAKHRIFTFLATGTLPDQGLVPIATDDGLLLGVLSSELHHVWARATGGTLEDRPRYNQSTCFEPFPFPNLHTADKFGGPIGVALVNADGTASETEAYGEYPSERIRNLGEQLDAHRKRQQVAHSGLTLTGMYNVLDALRSGQPLTAKERAIHEQGLVSVLRQLHDELDEAVLYAYGWGDLLPLLRVAHGNQPPGTLQHLADTERDLPERERHLHGRPAATREDAKRAFDEAILERLVALNAERAAEEARGHVRWLRPEFQDPSASSEGVQGQLQAGEFEVARDPAPASAAAKPIPWPKDSLDQVRAVAEVLGGASVPLSVDDVASRFVARGSWKRRLPRLLEMLVALGRADERGGRYSSL